MALYMSEWKSLLELDRNRRVTKGTSVALCQAIGRAADLRIYTEFKYGEHIEPGSPNLELVQEVSDFRVTYLVDDRWVAGIMNLRVPAHPPHGFGPRMSMSYFMYNQDGSQAIARPYLDGPPAAGTKGSSPIDDHSDMPKYHQFDNWDVKTNAPSSNFIYDFETFRFFVRDDWREVYSNSADGSVLTGSLDALIDAFANGSEIKVAISDPCAELSANDAPTAISHELFVHAGPGYYNTDQRLFCVESQPAVRVKPAIPMKYTTDGWDFGWFLLRTDGLVSYWRCDPYTLAFEKRTNHFAIRWFVR